jgi:hypothetical protein
MGSVGVDQHGATVSHSGEPGVACGDASDSSAITGGATDAAQRPGDSAAQSEGSAAHSQSPRAVLLEQLFAAARAADELQKPKPAGASRSPWRKMPKGKGAPAISRHDDPEAGPGQRRAAVEAQGPTSRRVSAVNSNGRLRSRTGLLFPLLLKLIARQTLFAGNGYSH